MHKIKKITKKKIAKGSLCLLISFLLISVGYLDSNINKNTISLITYTDNNIYTNLKNTDLISTLENNTGVFLIVNTKKDINKYVDLLYKAGDNEKIFVYNIKDDEIILKLDKYGNIKIKQEASEIYKELLKYIDNYAENYILITSENKLIETKYKKIYTPMCLFVSDGNILFSHYVYNEIDNEELINIYKEGFKKIKGYNS